MLMGSPPLVQGTLQVTLDMPNLAIYRRWFHIKQGIKAPWAFCEYPEWGITK